MTTLYTSFSLNATLKHDQHPDISYAFKAKTSPNIFDKDEITLSQAKENWARMAILERSYQNRV